MKPSPRLFLGALLLPLVAACHSYRPVTAAAPEGMVRVTFTPPRDVQMERENTPTQVLHDVAYLEGRVAAVAGDTAVLDATEIRDSRGSRMDLAAKASERVIFVVDATARIEQREFSAAKTLAGATGLVLLLTTVALVALIDVLVRAAR